MGQTKCMGDNDPIDVVEIGSKAMAQDDPMAAKMNDIGDVPAEVISGIREWFRWYRTPDDKPLNSFGFDEKALNKAETIKIIDETHEAWKKLTSGGCDAGKLWVPSMLFSQTSTDVSSLAAVALISALTGYGLVFVVLQIRRSSSAANVEPLLPA